MTVKDEILLEALLNTPNKVKAAAYAGCDRGTIYHRLKDPEFVGKLEQASELRRKTIEAQATSLCETATDVLVEIMTDSFYEPRERLRCAQIILATYKPK